MNRNLLQQLGIEHPIIQAPMAGFSTPAMTAAVSNAGALGSVALGASTVAQAQDLLAQTRKLTSKPFNVNFFCHRPATPDTARDEAWAAHLRPYLEELGGTISLPLKEIYKSFLVDTDMQELMLTMPPAVISFHFGIPSSSIISKLKDAGIFLMASATSLAEARLIEAAGLDAIVAQGVEAGGHRGVFDSSPGDAQIGTFSLVRLIAKQCSLPVIASGGIMDGQGIAAALTLGAQAAQLGTAFLLTPESNTSAGHRQLLQSPRAENTKITSAISGRGARGLVNRIISEVGSEDSPPTPDYPIAYDAGKQLHALALKQGSSEFGALWAGQGAPLIRQDTTAGLITTLVAEYRAAK